MRAKDKESGVVTQVVRSGGGEERERGGKMGEERISSPLASSLRSNFTAANNTTSIRFLSVLQHPNPDNEDVVFELDESDVVWSPSASYGSPRPEAESEQALSNLSVSNQFISKSPPFSPDPASNGWSSLTMTRSFQPVRFGLSAALSEEPKSLVPSISAAKAVPQSLLRSSSGLDSSPSMMRSSSGKLIQMSAPVKVPIWRAKERKGFDGNGRFRIDEEDEMEEEDENEEEMVPPHLMVARSHVSTFSVFEGVGRTLKGRDLRRVRNAVLQQTGFLD